MATISQTNASILAAISNLNNVNVNLPNLALPGAISDGVNKVKGVVVAKTANVTSSLPGVKNNKGFTI